VHPRQTSGANEGEKQSAAADNSLASTAGGGVWKTFPPGKMPVGRLIQTSDLSDLADRGLNVARGLFELFLVHHRDEVDVGLKTQPERLGNAREVMAVLDVDDAEEEEVVNVGAAAVTHSL
jgi:hypothetical protein